jgi:hypothetical protein
VAQSPPGFSESGTSSRREPVAFWRWEQLEKGRDGQCGAAGESTRSSAITMLGRYRVDATINSQNQITRIKTTVGRAALGDFNIEHESTNQISFRQHQVANRVALTSRVG